jgi:small-conductance mechanosensitive channel
MCSAQSAPPLTIQQTPTAALQSQLDSNLFLRVSPGNVIAQMPSTPAGAAGYRAGMAARERAINQRQQIVEELDRRDALQKEQERIAQERQQILDQQMKDRQRLTEEMLTQQQKASADAEESQRQSIAQLAQARAAQQQEILRMQTGQAAEIKAQRQSQEAEIAKQQLASDAASSSLRALAARRPMTSAPTATQSKRKGRRSGSRTGKPANDLRIGSSNVATGAGVNIGG